MTAKPLLMRSKLFVPASRPALFDKALAGPADAISFDLEDAVAAEAKPGARAALAQWLARPRSAAPAAPAAPTDPSAAPAEPTDPSAAPAELVKTLIVRVNALGSPHFEDDLRAVVLPAVQWINLPKAEAVADVLAAAQALERAERQNGVAQPLGLLLNIETPRGLRNAAALAGAHPRVVGLQVGLGDLFEPIGMDRRDSANVRHVLLQVRLAAAEAGVWACDGAFADIADSDGFRAEAALARACGLIGKSCIHPSQVSLANAVFSPRADELRHALRVVEAAGRASARAQGVFTVDGRMVDAPFVRRAEVLLAQARQLGLPASGEDAADAAPRTRP